MILNELGEKSRATIIFGSKNLAYSLFQKIFFSGQNLKHVHMTYSFLEILIFFWLTLEIYCLKFISRFTKDLLHVNLYFMGNQSWSKNKHFYLFLILIWRWKNLFFNVKLILLIHFSQLHELIFRSSRTQMLLKIGALENFAILRIKWRLQHSCFPVRSSH